MKASNPVIMVQAYRLLVAEMYNLGWDYPLHLGVTEAGEGEDGRMKSAIGIGTLLTVNVQLFFLVLYELIFFSYDYAGNELNHMEIFFLREPHGKLVVVRNAKIFFLLELIFGSFEYEYFAKNNFIIHLPSMM
jgi:hypothetical protein